MNKRYKPYSSGTFSSGNGRFYRDAYNQKISGVCAGVARYFRFPTWSVRLATLLLFFTFPVLVVLAYAIAHYVLPQK